MFLFSSEDIICLEKDFEQSKSLPTAALWWKQKTVAHVSHFSLLKYKIKRRQVKKGTKEEIKK